MEKQSIAGRRKGDQRGKLWVSRVFSGYVGAAQREQGKKTHEKLKPPQLAKRQHKSQGGYGMISTTSITVDAVSGASWRWSVQPVIVSGLNFSGRWAASYTVPSRRDANSAKVAKAVKSSLSPWF